jgi:hypothetical protein
MPPINQGGKHENFNFTFNFIFYYLRYCVFYGDGINKTIMSK